MFFSLWLMAQIGAVLPVGDTCGDMSEGAVALESFLLLLLLGVAGLLSVVPFRGELV